jgi:hypothetical protein
VPATLGDDLYGLPLDEFVAQRSALAKALKTEGRRADADAVTKLRKPTVAAWAVNQLVRTQRRAVDELLEAGGELREAQEALLGGSGDARALRAAAERERAAVDELVGLARGLLTSQGHELSATVIERVADTLHAAALDDDARELVRDGRLERELRHVGLGLGLGGAAMAPPAEKAKAKAPAAKAPASKPAARAKAPARKGASPAEKRAADADARRAERERLAQERAEREQTERERERARKAARVAESEARRRADRTARSAQVAEERRDRAEQALRKAEEALDAALEKAETAAQEHREAERTLKEV